MHHGSDRTPAQKASAVHVRIFDGQRFVERSQLVVNERPVTLYLNQREMVTLLCAGKHLDELAVGFFHGEGFLQSRTDLQEVAVDDSQGKVQVIASRDASLAENLWQKRTITSGCGKGSLFYYAVDALLSKPVESSVVLSAQRLRQHLEALNRMSETYRQTHGVHNSALATPDEILLFRDDIGRHNAVDMIVGHAFLHGTSLQDKLLITTGRLTSEILIKAAKVGIPVLISRNTATSLAVQLANSLNITLVGFARAGKFTVYSGAQRIISEA